jgi:hypothetical protein
MQAAYCMRNPVLDRFLHIRPQKIATIAHPSLGHEARPTLLNTPPKANRTSTWEQATKLRPPRTTTPCIAL